MILGLTLNAGDITAIDHSNSSNLTLPLSQYVEHRIAFWLTWLNSWDKTLPRAVLRLLAQDRNACLCATDCEGLNRQALQTTLAEELGFLISDAMTEHLTQPHYRPLTESQQDHLVQHSTRVVTMAPSLTSSDSSYRRFRSAALKSSSHIRMAEMCPPTIPHSDRSTWNLSDFASRIESSNASLEMSWTPEPIPFRDLNTAPPIEQGQLLFSAQKPRALEEANLMLNVDQE